MPRSAAPTRNAACVPERRRRRGGLVEPACAAQCRRVHDVGFHGVARRAEVTDERPGTFGMGDGVVATTADHGQLGAHPLQPDPLARHPTLVGVDRGPLEQPLRHREPADPERIGAQADEGVGACLGGVGPMRDQSPCAPVGNPGEATPTELPEKRGAGALCQRQQRTATAPRDVIEIGGGGGVSTLTAGVPRRAATVRRPSAPPAAASTAGRCQMRRRADGLLAGRQRPSWYRLRSSSQHGINAAAQVGSSSLARRVRQLSLIINAGRVNNVSTTSNSATYRQPWRTGANCRNRYHRTISPPLVFVSKASRR